MGSHGDRKLFERDLVLLKKASTIQCWKHAVDKSMNVYELMGEMQLKLEPRENMHITPTMTLYTKHLLHNHLLMTHHILPCTRTLTCLSLGIYLLKKLNISNELPSQSIANNMSSTTLRTRLNELLQVIESW